MRRHHWKLSAGQKENLYQYLGQEPVLRALYFAKQQLNGFLAMKSLKAKRAKQMLPKFLALIRQFEQSPARALAETLKSWLEPIVRMWRFTKSNGITEGFHTKMEMLSRRVSICTRARRFASKRSTPRCWQSLNSARSLPARCV